VNAATERTAALREALALLTARNCSPDSIQAVRDLLTDRRPCETCGGSGLQPLATAEEWGRAPAATAALTPSALRLLRDIVAYDKGHGIHFTYRAGVFTHPDTGRGAKRVTFELLASAGLITFAYTSRMAAATDAGRAHLAYGGRAATPLR
jgi:hypothetical protein